MFIIITHPRTASELLIGSLRIPGEILNPNRNSINLPSEKINYFNKIKTPRYIQNDALKSYVQEFLQKNGGFKVVYEQLDKSSIVTNYLQSLKPLKIIFLQRDIVDSAISYWLAYKSSVWQNPHNDEKCLIDMEFVKDFYQKSLGDFNFYIDFFKNNETLVMHYDDVINNWDVSIGVFQDFIGLERTQTNKSLQKRTKDIASIIINYQDCIDFRNSITLPKKIHFIWIGSPVPSKYIENIKTYRYYNPNYEIYLWTDHTANIDGIKVKAAISDNVFYHQESQVVAKADILRYEIIFKEGGIYCDIDSICIKPIETLLRYSFVSATFEPFNNLTNAAFGFPPSHPFIQYVLDSIKTHRHEDNVTNRTGPNFFTKCYMDYNKNHNWRELCEINRHEIIHQDNLIFPFYSKENHRRVGVTFHTNDCNWGKIKRSKIDTKISFCTTIRNRLSHLEKTLPQNINSLKKHDVEFIIVDYGSTDKLQEWIKPYVANKLVNYFYVHDQSFWRNSHAKNISVLCASRDIVCNVDADNYINDEFVDFIVEYYSKNEQGVLSGPPAVSGATGRIVCKKKDFLKIGGYNEEFKYGWGCEDIDLVTRLNLQGHKIDYIPLKFLDNIEHGDNLRHCNAEIKDKAISNGKSLSIMVDNLKKEKYIANNCSWGAATVTKNFASQIKVRRNSSVIRFL